MEELIPTEHYDIFVAGEMAETLEGYRNLRSEVFLLGGTKSKCYPTKALEALEQVMPDVRRVELKGLGHLAAAAEGIADCVAILLRDFFLARTDGVPIWSEEVE